MQGFDEVKFGWGGETFTVPADQQLELIARIEDALAGPAGDQALVVLLRPGGPPYSRLASAFGAALRYAGADVSDSDIYLSIQDDLAKGNADATGKIQTALLSLISVISPPMGRAMAKAKPEK